MAFEAQDFATAAERFDLLDRAFGEEPEYQSLTTQQVVLPLHGYALLVRGKSAEAIERFETFLKQFPGHSRKEAFVLFSLGQALHWEGRWSDSREIYKRFATIYADTPEAGIAHLRVGESFVEEGRMDEALEAYDAFFASRFAFSLRLQARLRGLQLALENARWDVAASYILETRWELETMPELAILAYAALEIGDYLLGEERFEEAVRAYRLVPGYAELKRRQGECLARTEASFDHHASFVGDGASAVWSDFYRGLIVRLRALQTKLEEGSDFTGRVLLRYGQAFAGAGRHYEAWTVLAEAAEDETLLPAEREEAHYRWVIEAEELERWSDALTIARAYVARYPDSGQAPIVLFLLANAHQQLGNYEETVAILDELLREYPDHSLHGRWLFSRGFNFILLESFTYARNDLETYERLYPSGSLALEARLWHALAWYFEKQYEPALAGLSCLLSITPRDHYLRPEIAYRRAVVLYAQREYVGTLSQLDDYFAAFPEDRNGPEAKVLRGDALMGLGQLDEAAATFACVGPSAGLLFSYAVFQQGKIFRALEHYQQMAEHFRHYVERTDLNPHPRRAEALHWLGWAMEQDGRLRESIPVYLGALERFANNPDEGGIAAILGSLQRVHEGLRATLPAKSIDPSDPFLGTPDFMEWLQTAEELAMKSGRLTAFSRYRLYGADRLRTDGQREEAERRVRVLGNEVDPSRLDAEGLAAVGKARLASGESDAEGYFEDLLKRFPESSHRVSARLGLGQAALAREDPDIAARRLAPVLDELLHPDAPEAVLLYGEALLQLGRTEELDAAMESLLRLRSARGRPHARALLLLARSADAAEDFDRAIPIYQRVYNLYRGYPEIVAAAYVRSAELFEQTGDLRAARNTWREVLYFEALTQGAIREQAEVESVRLDALVPPDPESTIEASAEEAVIPTQEQAT